MLYPCLPRLIACLISFLLLPPAQAADLGLFEKTSDVGPINLKGTSEFLAEKGIYRITGSGKNIWFAEDAFHFLWKKTTGNLLLSMEAGWEGEGKEPHRKVCAMVRQSLEADSPYVDVAVHGDGLIELQFRMEKGALTSGIKTDVKAPAQVRLERDGDTFTASVSKGGAPFRTIGTVTLPLSNPLYVGLGVSAHNAANLETALVSKVSLTAPPQPGEATR